MALGTITADPPTAAVLRKLCGDDVFVDVIQFLGDDAYPAGGTADFTAYYRSLRDGSDDVPVTATSGQSVNPSLGSTGNRQIVGVITLAADDDADPPVASPPHRLVYDSQNDKLIVVNGAAEATPGDLSAIRFHAVVLSC